MKGSWTNVVGAAAIALLVGCISVGHRAAGPAASRAVAHDGRAAAVDLFEQAATQYGHENLVLIVVGVQRNFAKMPFRFPIPLGYLWEISLRRYELRRYEPLVRHGLIRIEREGKIGLVVSLTNRGRAFVRRYGSPRCFSPTAGYCWIPVGFLRDMRVLSLDPLPVTDNTKGRQCYVVHAAGTFVLNGAGRELEAIMPEMPEYSILQTAPLEESVNLRATFVDAGKVVRGSFPVCQTRPGVWDVFWL